MFGVGQPLVQPRANVIRCVRGTTTLIARDQHSAGGDSDDTGQSYPLPHAAHGVSVPKLRW